MRALNSGRSRSASNATYLGLHAVRASLGCGTPKYNVSKCTPVVLPRRTTEKPLYLVRQGRVNISMANVPGLEKTRLLWAAPWYLGKGYCGVRASCNRSRRAGGWGRLRV
jgi:hypothetical protein